MFQVYWPYNSDHSGRQTWGTLRSKWVASVYIGKVRQGVSSADCTEFCETERNKKYSFCLHVFCLLMMALP